MIGGGGKTKKRNCKDRPKLLVIAFLLFCKRFFRPCVADCQDVLSAAAIIGYRVLVFLSTGSQSFKSLS